MLNDERRMLLDLCYEGKISAHGFQQEETQIATTIEAVRQQSTVESHEERLKTDLEVRFEEVSPHPCGSRHGGNLGRGG